MTLTFLHLSDIHLNRRHATHWDPDEDLRRELLRDLGRMRGSLGPADLLLVTGDISYSGTRAEYDQLGGWIAQVTQVACKDAGRVLMVPGNHDVDRSVASRSRALRALHNDIRAAPDDRLDRELEDALNDADSGPLMLQPLEGYNQFASRFGCQISPDHPWWERSFVLGHGYSLEMRGATTVLISDRSDDDGDHRLIVPSQMMRLPRSDHGVGAVMAHHPPDWIRQRDKIIDALEARARLQLFGHKHKFRAKGDGNRLIVHAGATHPEHDKEWLPHYNILQLETRLAAEGTMLRATVHPRRWHTDELTFGVEADWEGRPYRIFDIRLGHAPSAAPAPGDSPAEETGATSKERETIALSSPPTRTLTGRQSAELNETSDRGRSVRTNNFAVMVPRLGAAVVEVTLSRWRKREGDTVTRDEPLCDIATDKADWEMPSPVTGVLLKIFVQQGGVAMVGSEVAIISQVADS